MLSLDVEGVITYRWIWIIKDDIDIENRHMVLNKNGWASRMLKKHLEYHNINKYETFGK